MRSAGKRASLLFCILCGFSSISWSQEAFKPPGLDLSAFGPNIFTAQQEQELGEVIASRLSYLPFSDDPAVTAYLERIGGQLLRYLPPTEFRFHYFLVDSAAADAFSIPGGRIYISRGMAAQMRSPDEIAAILAHEMGHIVTHQGAHDATFLLEQVLSVTQVTDRLDIQKKFDQLEINWRRNPSAFRQVAHRREQGQLLADQVGIYAITAAGYSPDVYPALFDRLGSTGSNTGSWFSDLLHSTTPDQLRLRALLKAVQNLPQACIARQPGPDAGDFQQWRMAVLDFTGWNKRTANLYSVLAQVKLDSFAVGDVHYLRFSPDGKFLLAAKGQSLFIFTRDPFALLFRIRAPDARQPSFTPDSKAVAFTSAGTRLEVWDLASQKRVRIDEPKLSSICSDELVSSNVRDLACLRGDGTLDLVHLPSGALILEKKRFAKPSHSSYGVFLSTHHMEFSPDGHYFVAEGEGGIVALDLISGKEIGLRWGLKDDLARGFVFLGNDHLLAWPPPGLNATLYEFPAAKAIDKIPVARWEGPVAATHGNYLLMGPVRNYPLGRPVQEYALDILDLSSKNIVWGLKERTADVYDDVYAHQLVGGDLGLYDMHTGKLQARAAFPPAEDARAYWGAKASPSLKWLVASAGAIWDLGNGKMVRIRSFHGGGFDGDDAFCADFPAYRDTPRALALLNLAQGDLTPGPKIEDPYTSQYGLYLVAKRPQQPRRFQAVLNPCNWNFPDFDPMDCDVTYEVKDSRTGRVLWTRRFPKEVPGFQVEPEQGRVVLRWAASVAAVSDEIKNYPEVAEDWAAVRKHPGAEFVEILNLPDGSVRRTTLLDSGAAMGLRTAGERLLVSHQGYIEVFSLTTGAKEGDIPGRPRAVSISGNLLSVAGDASNELEIYDLQSRQRLDHFAFSTHVDFDQFSADGKRLLVLTSDQTAYFLDMTALRPSASTRQ
jgi:WD40 repeat protein